MSASSGPAGPAGPPARLARVPMRPGMVTQAELDDGIFSNMEVRAAKGKTPAYALIAPHASELEEEELPTVVGISGEEQMHVSRFIRSWRAEDRNWQVVVPLRKAMGTPYFFDPQGVEAIVAFIRLLLDDEERQIIPFGVERGKIHLFGSSNGGAAAVAVAARIPELVSSLTVATGFIPDSLQDFLPLAALPLVRLYVGDRDEYGHNTELAKLQRGIELAGGSVEFHLLEGAGHFNIGQAIDLEAFWDGFEGARTKKPPCVGCCFHRHC